MDLKRGNFAHFDDSLLTLNVFTKLCVAFRLRSLAASVPEIHIDEQQDDVDRYFEKMAFKRQLPGKIR